MNRLEINPNNEKYYSKEFIQGYECGTKSQFDADMKVFEQITAEQKALITTNSTADYSNGVMNCLNIIDKYRCGRK